MSLKRRHFLMFLGASATAVACGQLGANQQTPSAPALGESSPVEGLSFQPIKGPMPLEIDNIATAKQVSSFSTYEVVDDLVLPEGFTYDVIAAWGDKLGDSRVGYNNDYLSFIETGKNEGFLTINFEYISGKIWMQTYQKAIAKSLPFEEVIAVAKATDQIIDAFALPDNNPLKTKIREMCLEALEDQGLGIIFIRQNANGRWERTESKAERRISGVSGLKGRYLKATGPAVLVFKKEKKQGYDDSLGDKIVGTMANCAGGTTPWGTVLSAEENFQAQVAEAVYPDGSSFSPGTLPFGINEEGMDGQGNVLGLAGNKYGYMVEIDPANPNDYGTKHTWLGRYRHEAVGFRVVEGKPLAVYSGCDRQGGHLYKFISKDSVSNRADKVNSRLMEDGMLYAAVFEPNGTGRWIPLRPDTAVNPVLPSTVQGGMVPLPQRPNGGIFKAEKDEEAIGFKKQFKTLGDLYTGNAEEKQGAILIDAHYAANAAGATPTARPEDTEVAADGSLYIAFTSGSSGSDGGPDKRVFKGPKGEVWDYGSIVRLNEDGNNPAAMTFKWEIMAMGGEPTAGGAGFSNPDNLLIDDKNNVWVVTDMSTDKHNNPEDKKRQGCFGNNSFWFIPTSGTNAGNAYLFGMGPMECELTGPFFTPDRQTLFLSVQHPGERNGIRVNGASQARKFNMKTTDGQEFVQQRQVPIGSNWPSKKPNDPPRPAVVAIRHTNSQPIV